MINVAFAGFKHDHINVLYNDMKKCSEFEIIGAWESDEATAESAQKAVGADFKYSTYSEILDDKSIDVIAIGDSYGIRGRLIISALKAGKHVIVDKPMCISLDELDEIEKLAQEKKLQVHCMFTMRYLKRVNTVKAFIQNGGLGEIHNLYFGGEHPLNYGKRPMWYFDKNGSHGGVINDIAVHGIDLLSYMLGKKPKDILAARCWNAYADKELHFKDCAQFMLSLTDGTGVLADVSYSAPSSQGFTSPLYWEFNIFGKKGALKFSANSPINLWLDGEEQCRVLDDEGEDFDEVLDFAKQIRNEKDTILNRDDVFFASRWTLNIQKMADNM